MKSASYPDGNFGRDPTIAKHPDRRERFLFIVEPWRSGCSDIADGTGQTVLVGERERADCTLPWDRRSTAESAGSRPGLTSRSTSVKTAPVEPLARADTAGGTSTNLFFDPDDFFSPHPAGLYFLMCDGSVRFLKMSVNPNVYGDSVAGTSERLSS